MSRSNPRRSPIVEKLLRASDAGVGTPPHLHPSHRRRFSLRVAALMRWLHIYLSLFGLASVLFFSVTGITLNHPDWLFGSKESRSESKGTMNPAWLRLPSSSGAPEGTDSDVGVSRAEVIEHLRRAHRVRGTMSEFTADDAECRVTFRGPGYAADATIERDSGRYTISETSYGLVAVVNDLHKGRDTGRVWSWVIDVSAVLLAVISLTGFVLLFYLKLRRVRGVIVAVLGGVVLLAFYWLVP